MSEFPIQSQQEIKDWYDNVYKEGDIRDNEKLYDWIIKLISPTPGKTFLDVACGGGWMLRAASKRQLKTYGLDISSNAVEKAKNLSPKFEVTVGSGESLPYPDNFFDYVTCLGSLEHFIHPNIGAKEIYRVLKPTGVFAILLPNKFQFGEIIKVLFTGDSSEQWQIVERAATKIEWQKFLNKNGLKVDKIYNYNKYPELFKPGTRKMKSIRKFIVASFFKYCSPFNFALSFVYVGRKINK